MAAAVEALEVRRTFQIGENTVHALAGVSFGLPAGSLAILRGRSGSGKTTLLNILGGLDFPSSGRVIVGGRDLQAMSDAELTLWRRAGVGFIFQSFALMPHLTALENVELAVLMLAAILFGGGCWLLPKEKNADLPVLIKPPDENLTTYTLAHGGRGSGQSLLNCQRIKADYTGAVPLAQRIAADEVTLNW